MSHCHAPWRRSSSVRERVDEERREPADDGGELADLIAAAELRAALREFQRRSEQIGRRAGLTPQRYLLLLMIEGAADGSRRATVSSLTRSLQLAQSTVTELVQRAENSGLLEREPVDPRTRSVGIRVTAEGRRRLEQAFRELATERQRLSEAIRDLDL